MAFSIGRVVYRDEPRDCGVLLRVANILEKSPVYRYVRASRSCWKYNRKIENTNYGLIENAYNKIF